MLLIVAPTLGITFYFVSNSLVAFIIYCCVFFFKTTHSVNLKGSEIISGLHLSPFGFLKIKKRMALNDIQELVIYKNEKKYSEIRAVSATDFLIIKTIANRIPAEEELKEIQAKIYSFKQNILNFN